MRLSVLAIAMFALPVTVCENKQNKNVDDLDHGVENWTWSNVNMPIEMPHAVFWLAIAMMVISITACEIITYELPNVLYSK